jgi:hypothetical protein
MNNFFQKDLTKKIFTAVGCQTKQEGHVTGPRTQENKPEMDDISAIMCMDNGDIPVLKNIHDTPKEGNFCDERGNAIKPLTVVDYKPHTYYAYKGDRTASSYSISCSTWT